VPARASGRRPTAAAADRLSKVVIGAPGSTASTMGALVSTAQRDDVRRAVAHPRIRRPDRLWRPRARGGRRCRLRSGSVPLASGSCRSPTPDGPSRMRSRRFGPVCTLMPYTDTDGLLDPDRPRSGVPWPGSIVSHEPRASSATSFSAPRPSNGRLLVLDRDNAGESTGHGIPMPQLVHGGPGRRPAGGQEEGGLRPPSTDTCSARPFRVVRSC